MRAILESQSLAGTGLQELMREMLVRLGEDPERDGLRDTPERMERSMQYLTKDYQENPAEILLGAMFDVAYKDIEMFSLCEHHLLPFFGKGSRRLYSAWESRSVASPLLPRRLRAMRYAV